MAVVAGQAGEEAKPGLGRLRTGQAGCRCSHMKHANDRSAQGAGIGEMPSRGIRSGNAALAVGRTGKRNAGARAGQRMRGFRCVAHCVNVRIRRFQPGVGLHTPGDPDFDSGFLGETDLGLHAHAEKNQFRGDERAVRQFDAPQR